MNAGRVPIAFNVPLDTDLLDPNADALLFALINDGDRAWATRDGVPVATHGAPSEGVVVELTFRPDLLEGQVTGTTAGAAPDLSSESVAMTWVLDATTLAILGFDARSGAGLDPIPFDVPFAVDDIELEQNYVAESFVYDVERTWATVDGTPVITAGNPMREITVMVAQLTPLATPATSPSPPPTPGATRRRRRRIRQQVG